MMCLHYFIFYSRTKWKRQNQLRLEQLRHQSNMEKEMISVNENTTKQLMSGSSATTLRCCQSPSSISALYSSNPFLTSAAAAVIFRNVSYVQGGCIMWMSVVIQDNTQNNDINKYIIDLIISKHNLNVIDWFLYSCDSRVGVSYLRSDHYKFFVRII